MISFRIGGSNTLITCIYQVSLSSISLRIIEIFGKIGQWWYQHHQYANIKSLVHSFRTNICRCAFSCLGTVQHHGTYIFAICISNQTIISNHAFMPNFGYYMFNIEHGLRSFGLSCELDLTNMFASKRFIKYEKNKRMHSLYIIIEAWEVYRYS